MDAVCCDTGCRTWGSGALMSIRADASGRVGCIKACMLGSCRHVEDLQCAPTRLHYLLSGSTTWTSHTLCTANCEECGEKGGTRGIDVVNPRP
jgi:hypothetical protein